MNPKRRSVSYEKSVLTYIDILGFSELITNKSAGDIPRSIRVVREAAQPKRFKSITPEISEADFRNFSDLCIIRKVITGKGKFPASGEVHSQILHMVHVQTGLLFDEGILLRGGIYRRGCRPQLWPAVRPRGQPRLRDRKPGREVSAHRRRRGSVAGSRRMNLNCQLVAEEEPIKLGVPFRALGEQIEEGMSRAELYRDLPRGKSAEVGKRNFWNR
jgi:hypothetical protein